VHNFEKPSCRRYRGLPQHLLSKLPARARNASAIAISSALVTQRQSRSPIRAK
jgi:hypothetical protein